MLIGRLHKVLKLFKYVPDRAGRPQPSVMGPRATLVIWLRIVLRYMLIGQIVLLMDSL